MSAENKHIVSYKTFVSVWVILMFLTAVTVWIAKIDLGFLNVVAALTVATTKALIVILFFMHLKYENRLFKISVFITFLILAIFIGFTFFDVAYR
ncbi:MAG: cytochrome c oxidase subunit [Deferribacteres bacterium]|jgi:cytochrome c oxidase subunit 4|nr:caa(3)-type oxidase, subunit [Deferribacteraceae bacterium]MDK2793058.1 cytochrome c oxidase subunit [Deferribacteres bacterium]